jgi:uncharacterized protein (TIGR03437 family)
MPQTIPWLVLLLLVAAAAQTIPIRTGDPIRLIPPAVSADGSTVVFAAATAPDGTPQTATNLYVASGVRFGAGIRQLTKYGGDTLFLGVSNVTYPGTGNLAGFTALPTGPGGAEEVHIVDVNTGSDRLLVTDKEGCIQPLIACVNCFRACVGPVHMAADGTKVVYAVARQQPFATVNADGTGWKQLPVYSGTLAPSPQRAISRAGVLVFTSSAPSGPAFAAAATDVHTINLDGTGLRQVTKFGSAMFFASHATISADGSLIAFQSNFGTAPQQADQIWVVAADGSGLRQVSGGAGSASAPSISGDGSMVAFLQGGQIKRVRTRTTESALALTKLSTSAPGAAVLSEDGTQAVVTLGPLAGTPAAVYRISADATTELRSFPIVYAPRLLFENGVASAAGYGAPAPGSLISAYGVNLAVDELAQASGFPLPPLLKEVSLAVNGQPVPLLATTPWQINAHLPQTVPAGTAAFQVRYTSGGTTRAVNIEVKNSAPENFWFPFARDRLYYPQAAAYHAGTAIAADMDHPAAAGETLEIYGLGLGTTDPPVDAGVASPASPPARAREQPRVRIGNREATVVWAGLAPGLAGVCQVNVVVPSGLAPGIQTVSWIRAEGAAGYSSIAVK